MATSTASVIRFGRLTTILGLIDAGSAAALAFAGPDGIVRVALAGVVVASWIVAAVAHRAWIGGPFRRVAERAADELVPKLRGLGTAISTFAAGDLTVRARHQDSSALCSSDLVAAFAAIEESVSAGIADFNEITARPSKRICFSGCNSYDEGRVAGEQIRRILGDRGRIICLIPSHAQVNHALRLKGCLNYLAQSKAAISVVRVAETMGTLENARVLAAELFA